LAKRQRLRVLGHLKPKAMVYRVDAIDTRPVQKDKTKSERRREARVASRGAQRARLGVLYKRVGCYCRTESQDMNESRSKTRNNSPAIGVAMRCHNKPRMLLPLQ
jgi:hypothetical protein